MPQVTMLFKPNLFSGNGRDRILPNLLERVGREIMPLIAEAFSFGPAKLDPVMDIDWLPTPYPPGSLVFYPVSIEIMTIGYPERKAKVTEGVMEELKLQILAELQELKFPGVDASNPLLWVIYTDPDGLHI